MPAEAAAFGGEFVVSAQAPHTLPDSPLQRQAAHRALATLSITVHETAVVGPPHQGVAVVTKITLANATDGINAGSLLLLIVLAYGRGATHCCRTLLALRPKSIMAIVRCNLFAAPGRLHSSWHLSLHLPLRIIAAASSRSLAAAIAYECLRTFSYWSLVYGFVDCG